MNIHVARNCAVVAILSLALSACDAGEPDSEGTRRDGFGLTVTDDATPSDAGLPTYPGAKHYQDADEDSSNAGNISLSTRLFGFKVVAMSLETPDAPEKVAAFYRRALSKYGDVLDCSDAATTERKVESNAAQGDELTCDSDESETHSIVYKAGTEKNQRIVAIKPHGRGTRFSLVHVDVRGEEKD